MNILDSLLKLLTKYLFIMKAAADGWRVSYIGGNKFEFNNCLCQDTSPIKFINKYKYTPRLLNTPE